MKQMTFALCFANRGFMPGELVYEARKEMAQALEQAGYHYIIMDEDATRFGGVETRDEGRLYAQWLKSHEGEYDGVIFSMPIFADEKARSTRCRTAACPFCCKPIPMRSARWILPTAATPTAANSPLLMCLPSTGCPLPL